MGIGPHRGFVAKGGDDRIVGAQVNLPLVAIDQDHIAIQRFGCDFVGVDHQRDGERAGDDGRVRANRAFFEHDAFEFAAIIQQFSRANITGHKDRVVGHICAGVRTLSS